MSGNSKIGWARWGVPFRGTFLLSCPRPIPGLCKSSQVTSTTNPCQIWWKGDRKQDPKGRAEVILPQPFTILHECNHSWGQSFQSCMWKKQAKGCKRGCLHNSTRLSMMISSRWLASILLLLLSPYYLPGTVLSPWLALPLLLFTTTLQVLFTTILYGTIIVSIL